MSDMVFFVLSKILVVALQAESWILFGMLVTIWFSYRHQRRASLIAGAITAGVTFGLSLFPLGYPLIHGLEQRYPASPSLLQVDGVIILSGGELPARSRYWKQSQMNGSAERLIFGASLARQFPEAKIVFSGGSARLRDQLGDGPVEGHVARDLLLGLGVSSNRLVIEDRARNTYENAIFLYDLVKPKPDETWVLVTSAFHMSRSMRSFKRAGWSNVSAYPVDYQTGAFSDGIGWGISGHLTMLNVALKEQIGLLVYDLTGR
jgi:uncharacterized SAM-binding protein YcdF (DUF218 family)